MALRKTARARPWPPSPWPPSWSLFLGAFLGVPLVCCCAGNNQDWSVSECMAKAVRNGKTGVRLPEKEGERAARSFWRLLERNGGNRAQRPSELELTCLIDGSGVFESGKAQWDGNERNTKARREAISLIGGRDASMIK